MKKILIMIFIGFLSQSVIAQSSVESTDKIQIEHTVKDADSKEYKKCSSQKSSCNKEAKACCKGKKEEGCSNSKKAESCSKDGDKKETAKKCSKGDACCAKTGKKVADCDKKSQGCCKSSQKPTI